jgi:hypothetical protein
MAQEEETKALTHYDKVQILFNTIEQVYGANQKPTEGNIWVLVQNSGVTKEDVHNSTWHLREEQTNG